MRKSLIHYIWEIELKFPVNEWKISGVKIWPLIRVALVLKNDSFKIHQKNIQNSSYDTKKSLIIGLKKIIYGTLKNLTVKLKDFKNNEHKIKKKSYLIITRSLSRSFKYKENYYSPHCDTLKNYLQKLNFNSYIFEYEPTYQFHIPRFSKSKFIQIEMEKTKLLGKFDYLVKRKKMDSQLKHYEDFKHFLSEHNIACSYDTYEEIIYQTCVLIRRINFFKKMLKKYDPKAVFVLPYYSPEGMALVFACNDLNIKCMDIQHGMAGLGHIAYDVWKNYPISRYKLIPSLFWVWSNYEKKIITSWNIESPSNNRCFVGGNIWMDLWKDRSEEIVSTTLEELDYSFLKKDHLTILLALQPEQNNDVFYKIMNHYGNKVFWLLRLHPLMFKEIEQIKYKLNEFNIHQDNYDIENATKLPLSLVFEISDLQLTIFSTTAIEATNFGLKSIITDEDGAIYYRDQIKDDMVILASDYKTILNNINKFLESHIKKKYDQDSKKIFQNTNKLKNYDRTELIHNLIQFMSINMFEN